MSTIQTPENPKDVPLSVVKNMIMLATSGFGVVVALAWNELIKNIVAEYIDPIFGTNSGLISLFIYAVLMTLLAVLVTMQLAGIQRRLERVNQKKKLPPTTP